MEVILAIVTGVLYTAGVYLLLRRSLMKLILGIIFFSNATNLLIFLSAGLTSGEPPFLKEGEIVLTDQFADPIPQAIIITSLVIAFGIIVFTLVLKYKYYKKTGTYDTDQVKQTENL
ncbi:MAG: NADH-quinone oxidoreductase subunit K [Bacteroidales bacterium]